MVGEIDGGGGTAGYVGRGETGDGVQLPCMADGLI